MPTRVNAGGEDGSFYHSAHIVIIEFFDAAAFVGWVIQNGDLIALPQCYIHFYSVNVHVTGLSTWGWEHILRNKQTVASDVLLKHLPARNKEKYWKTQGTDTETGPYTSYHITEWKSVNTLDEVINSFVEYDTTSL